MFHRQCGAGCPAYDGCGFRKRPSTRNELRYYKLKCVSLKKVRLTHEQWRRVALVV